jgi:hypothetical protein
MLMPIVRDRREEAFNNLKDTLTSEQVLAYPDVKCKFILTTDASKTSAQRQFSLKYVVWNEECDSVNSR